MKPASRGPARDEIILEDVVAQTAEFRYRISWAGGRRLVKELGFDPLACIQTSCDQGDDVEVTLVLPDGRVVVFNMKEDPATRELVRISGWEYISSGDRHVRAAQAILRGEDTARFDQRVRGHYDAYWKGRDWPLLPKAPRQ
jgi:hypothetical protein